MDFMDTVKGSMLEGFYPEGWDMAKIDKCCQIAPEDVMTSFILVDYIVDGGKN